jgi:DNA-binding Lrp family transcriptional regulator
MLNSQDMQLITQLRMDARAKLTDISKRIRMPVSSIFEKLKRFSGTIIQKHATILNFSAIGYSVRVHIFLKVERVDKDQTLSYLIGHFNTNNLYRINNGYNVMADMVFKELKEVEELLEALQTKYHIKQTQVYYLLDELAREAFMAKPEWIGFG